MNGEGILLGTVAIVAGTAGLVMLGHVMVEQIKQRGDIGKIRDDLQLVADSTATIEHDVAIETDEDEGSDDDSEEDPDGEPDPESFRDPLLRRIYRSNLRKP